MALVFLPDAHESAEEIPISLKEIGKWKRKTPVSSGEISSWKREIPILPKEVGISLFGLPISRTDFGAAWLPLLHSGEHHF